MCLGLYENHPQKPKREGSYESSLYAMEDCIVVEVIHIVAWPIAKS